MLRITDARSGELVDAARPRRGLTRVEAHTSGSDLTNLRVLLVADTLVRALELGGTPVWARLCGERERAGLRAGAAALGVRPFEEDTDGDGAGLGVARVIHVAAGDGRPAGDGHGVEGPHVAVAPVDPVASAADVTPAGPGTPPAGQGASAGPGTSAGPAAPPGHAARDAARDVAQGPDPAALRLALLMRPRDVACRLGPEAVRDAHDTLARWRRAVAAWARLPSRPVPDEMRARVRAAWEADLDVPAVIEALRDVERDPDLPDGARFETYVHADRILGVDLSRDVGGPA
ncbi:MAG TPA: hypothetical protein VFP69_17110 [Streptomyces sp.]|nr:hypothetical protein [Streptomyces sp.]